MTRSEQEHYYAITVAVAQTILDCANHTDNAPHLVRHAAEDAGLFPLEPLDRKLWPI
jgi:hypothetical protein